MSLVSAIYNAPVVDKRIDEGDTILAIEYNHHRFYGIAKCHDDDMEFFSPKVGYRIAISRARILALYWELKQLRQEVEWKRRIYWEVARDKECEQLKTNLEHAEARLGRLQSALKHARRELHNNIEGQAKALESIKKYRANQDTDKDN